MGHGLLPAKRCVRQRKGGAPHDPAQTRPQTTAESQTAPLAEGTPTPPTGAGARTARPAGPGTGGAGVRCGQRVAEEVQWRLQAQQKLVGKIFGMMFPPGVWLLQLPGAVPGARLGPASARSDPGGLAQTQVGQAPAALGPGGPGVPVAAGRCEEPGDPQSVAVDLGG